MRVALADTGTGSISLTTLDVAIPTETFVTLSNTAGSTTNTTLPTGWYITETGGGARDNEQYAVDTGSSTTGDIFSYGAAASTERALGELRSGTLVPLFGAKFTNNTGATINSLDVSFTGEQWRFGGVHSTVAERLDFQYSVNATDLSTGTYLDANALDFNPLVTTGSATALDGNAAANRTAIASTITGLSIPNGATFFIRFNDNDATGADDGLAVDDFSVTPHTTAGVTLSINDVSQDEGNAGTTAFNFTVLLSSSTHGGVTFDICSQDGTAQDGSNLGEDTDYSPICFGAQSIPNGSSSAQYTVNVNGNLINETNETFFVNVTNVAGATVVDGQGQGTIQNDDVTLTPIHDIQGNGDASPLAGSSVTTTGIVTLLKTGQNTGATSTANGFFIQDPTPDADPNTSEGIFVFTSSVPTYTAGGTVAVGDELRVTGTVTEFNGLTEIGSVTNIAVIDTGNSLPAAVTLDSTILSSTAVPTQPQLEKYESMRMTGTMNTVAPNNNFFEVDMVLDTVARPIREPGIPFRDPVPPDPTSGLVDPNIPIWDENPERLSVDTNGRAGSPNSPYTSNVTFTGVSGPLDYSFGRYRLVPDASPSASANMTAVAVPTPLATEFTIASYNIENFNNNATQRQKAADTIRNVLHFPDIIGTVEIFDLADLQALRDQINNDAVANSQPNPMYEAYLIEQDLVSEDSDQDVGFLVKTSRVAVNTPPTQEREEETYAEPGGGDPAAILHDRPPFLLDATVDPLGANPRRVLVVINHLRSFIDIEMVAGDGPRVREKRKKQAESLADLLNDLQTANPGVPVISVGDYNEYEFSSGYDDSMSVIKGNPTADNFIVVDQSPDVVNPNLTNLTETLPAAERYSFMFDGTPQGLDHHVVNQAALARNTRVAIARVNSDFPEFPAATYASNTATPERNSDHDPVVSYYSLNQPQVAGSVIISEFRFRGPGGGAPAPPVMSQKIGKAGVKTPVLIGPVNQAQDEFVEIYNNTYSDITVSTTDGSAGWAVVAADGVTRFIIPNGTIIPARGHFLGVNTVGYSLTHYGGLGAAAGDSVLLADGVTPASGFTQDIPDGSGIALFRSANSGNFTLAERLDAAGYVGVDPLYREGTGFPTGGAETTGGLDYTFFRSMTRASGGLPKDTGNNLSDFLLADTAGTDFDPGAATLQRLGAPGPENLNSPINRTAEFGYALLDSAVSSESVPNRERNTTAVTNGDFGTLTIRRKFTNNTGETLSRLRFRIVEVTTFPSPVGSGAADLRALSSIDEPVTLSNSSIVVVRGTTLEQPPTQAIGGGWNATLNVPNVGGPPIALATGKASYDTPTTGTILLGAPLNNGESIDVQFKLGVMKTGFYFFYLTIEVSPGCPPISALLPCSVTRPSQN